MIRAARGRLVEDSDLLEAGRDARSHEDMVILVGTLRDPSKVGSHRPTESLVHHLDVTGGSRPGEESCSVGVVIAWVVESFVPIPGHDRLPAIKDTDQAVQDHVASPRP